MEFVKQMNVGSVLFKQDKKAVLNRQKDERMKVKKFDFLSKVNANKAQNLSFIEKK